jgi:hypothetical protein
MVPPIKKSMEVNRGSCRSHLEIRFCYSDVTRPTKFIATDSLREGSLDTRALGGLIPKGLSTLFLSDLLQGGMLFLR